MQDQVKTLGLLLLIYLEADQYIDHLENNPARNGSVDLEGFHGDDPISLMRAIFPELREVRMIPGAGHMVQLEASAAVNEILLDYLADISARL